ncbi:Attractin,Attractin-like protein 1 [Mytilus coruscus]|uniref:Attractin,Attractin-like protein 1 n=1 Tax=Mytilus coruscus TaxID=42192 RepID=A0A6J8DTK8_MYTCO|nr:Attractin,Attractin-like protein 1 [Mytilus coruscus]
MPPPVSDFTNYNLHTSCTTHCDEINCREGECINDSCICDKGWKGPACQHCTGRVRLTDKEGIIFDGYGNYSEDNKCTWLIAPENNTQPIHLQLKQFSTECGWDHLYIYDGDSTFSPLLVAFSGLLRQKNEDDNVLPEITTTSGNAYIYFYSDAAYNMSGFNISYRTGGCEKDCSLNGQCIKNKCNCFAGYTGSDCSLKSYHGVWSTLDINATVGGRASAAVAQVQDKLYLTGGYTFNNDLPFLARYDFTSDSWDTVIPQSTNNPESRYGHTLLEYQGSLYMFGGVVDKDTTKELWVYDLSSKLWTIKNYNSTPPVAVASHTAHVINGVMYILFGYSPIYGYKNRIQEYFIGNDTWIVPRTFGSVVEGGFGHSSVYDPQSKLIYVYGGYHAGDTSSDQLSDKLYSFDISTRFWKTLPRNERPRYLHSAVLIGGLMLVFGGNTHNDTSISLGAKCYSLDFLAYDTECNKWLEVDVTGLPSNGARYGHTAAVYKRNGQHQMYIIGGFNGMMQDNVMLFSPGDCNYTDPEFCTNSTQGSICVWTDSQTCISKDVLGTAPTNRSCSSTSDHNDSCKDVKDCRTCTSTCLSSHGDCTCQWCDSKCTYNCTLTQTKNCTTQTSNPFGSSVCSDHKHCPTCMSYGECDWSDKCSDIKEVESLAKYSSPCYATQNCFACIQSDTCEWNHSQKKCQAVIYTTDYNTTRQIKKCDQPCIAHKSCENCTDKGCMWCGNKQLCVQTNSYVASFIYGQCMEWTTQQGKCPDTRCSDRHTCDQCQANPKCGWCNDKTNTGLGKCMEGGLQGPVNNQSQIDLGSCDKNRWFFIGCPDCQCNGHSICSNTTGKTEVCVECKNMTEGDHCEHCKEGYHGNPVNGGICKRCECNEQADSCDRSTGVCNCRTRGVIGDKCDKCDESHKYFGDPKKGGTCFYHLVTDYQFTFNLSKKDDRFYTQINFMNIPQASDRDVDFKVNCSGESYLNISVRTKNNRVEKIYEAYPCTYFRTKFEHGDFSFGEKENTTFLVYVYGFHTPFWLQISFSQFPKIDLVHFFVTFFSCFLSLLIIAAVLYKIKHKYDLYRRRQRMMVEMEEMASRPFASVTVEIDRKLDLAEKKETNSVDLRKRKKGGTKPVAIQPLSGHKAAILSLIVLLPTGDEDLTPSGSSGVAIASALITMGHHRKQSLEHTKGEKTKYKKPFSSSHTDPV